MTSDSSRPARILTNFIEILHTSIGNTFEHIRFWLISKRPENEKALKTSVISIAQLPWAVLRAKQEVGSSFIYDYFIAFRVCQYATFILECLYQINYPKRNLHGINTR